MPKADNKTTGVELSIAIPCYNEEGNVEAIHEAVSAQARTHVASYEIIFIDNGSTDRTRELLRVICANDPNTRAIFNNRNYGQMRSPTHAIYQADGAAVIGMCADFQDPPALIGDLVSQWRAGAQIVVAQRRAEKVSWPLGIARTLGYKFLARYGDYPVVPGVTGFGLYDRVVVDMLASWNEPEPFFRGMLVESGYRLVVIPVDRPERLVGKTKNNFWSLLSFALSGLASSGKRLLRLPLLLSAYVGLFTFALLLATLLRLMLVEWSPVMVILTVLSGMFAVILLFLGLIGDQVRLLAERTRNLPLVIEEERLNFPEDRQAPHRNRYTQTASRRTE